MGRPGYYVRAYIVLSQRGFDIFVGEKEESKKCSKKNRRGKKDFRARKKMKEESAVG